MSAYVYVLGCRSNDRVRRLAVAYRLRRVVGREPVPRAEFYSCPEQRVNACDRLTIDPARPFETIATKLGREFDAVMPTADLSKAP